MKRKVNLNNKWRSLWPTNLSVVIIFYTFVTGFLSVQWLLVLIVYPVWYILHPTQPKKGNASLDKTSNLIIRPGEKKIIFGEEIILNLPE